MQLTTAIPIFKKYSHGLTGLNLASTQRPVHHILPKYFRIPCSRQFAQQFVTVPAPTQRLRPHHRQSGVLGISFMGINLTKFQPVIAYYIGKNKKYVSMERVSAQCYFHRQSIAHGLFPIQHPQTPSSHLSPFSKYLTCNFSNLKLGQFKVIQGQCSQCQQQDHRWFPI